MIDTKELLIDFKYIPGYEGLYSINKNGDVYSHYRNVILKTHTSHNGYLMINLYKGGISKLIPIHRLVALTFIPNPENKPEIDHIDTNRKNNSVDNLRWCTRKENCNNKLSIKHLKEALGGGKCPLRGRRLRPETIEKMSLARRGRKHSEEHKRNISKANMGKKLSAESIKKRTESRRGKYEGSWCNFAKSVSQFTTNMELVKTWDCIKTASKETGIDYHEILKCRIGKRESAGGYIWK